MTGKYPFAEKNLIFPFGLTFIHMAVLPSHTLRLKTGHTVCLDSSGNAGASGLNIGQTCRRALTL
ncbi:hypothetical protein M407DRAFT_206938 [Tulasnella calospora MUT 4182]|uniref:Uncharacterized protein n=1 Tax=Tulasnella calospora MUT 4182 TaxID=1051891 RepID=A0A0C3KWG3_9AGAM|nr:hypothetical protein M407DRAFT_206938 [Tulasnella calospora MUT 4182]